MCWRKIVSWFKPDPMVENKNKTALLFAINNYPHEANDLNGCINDQNDVADKLEYLFPGEWSIVKFHDSEVTKSNFRNTIKNYIVSMSSGDTLLIHYSGHGTQVPSATESDGYNEAVYLYDAYLEDDDFNEVLQLIPDGAKVIIALDSCFSGTATRLLNPRYVKSRYYPIHEIKGLKRAKKYLKSDLMKWVVFSGCREDQTSADAFISGRYNGAFTYYWLRALKKGITYQQWADDTIYGIHLGGFEQVPTIEGDSNLINQIIFT
jgi:metacaspase-1